MLLKLLLVLIIAVSSLGCSKLYVDGALLMHTESADAPEVTLQNPLAELEIGVESDRTSIFLRHTSGIFATEYGYGMNSVGIKHRLW